MWAVSLIWEPWAVRKPGWFEINLSKIGFALDLIYTGRDDDYPQRPWMLHFHLLWLSVFLHFPGPHLENPPTPDDIWGGSWGFTWCDDAIHWHWGKTYVKRLPWSYEQVRHEVKLPDGSWAPFVGSWERDKEPDGREVLGPYSYTYILRDGKIQATTATVYVERRARRPIGWKRTALFERVTTAISVSFADEVGDRAGSWKGGCIGCGYQMKEDETPLSTLRRMEQERRFR